MDFFLFNIVSIHHSLFDHVLEPSQTRPVRQVLMPSRKVYHTKQFQCGRVHSRVEQFARLLPQVRAINGSLLRGFPRAGRCLPATGGECQRQQMNLVHRAREEHQT